MNIFWGLFNKAPNSPVRETRHYIVEDEATIPIDSDYAELGYAEGWLVYHDMHIDFFNVEHIKYRHV